jgi:hypothetical protein
MCSSKHGNIDECLVIDWRMGWGKEARSPIVTLISGDDIQMNFRCPNHIVSIEAGAPLSYLACA